MPHTCTLPYTVDGKQETKAETLGKLQTNPLCTMKHHHCGHRSKP